MDLGKFADDFFKPKIIRYVELNQNLGHEGRIPIHVSGLNDLRPNFDYIVHTECPQTIRWGHLLYKVDNISGLLSFTDSNADSSD